MGPKLMNCCKPEQVGTENVKNGSRSLRMAGFWPRRLETGRLKDKIVESREKSITFLISIKMEGFMAHEDLWNLARESVLQDRGALPKEEDDVIREDMAMHEEIFLSSWLREDRKDKKENWMLTRKPKERRAKKDKRRGETRERDGDC